MPLVKLSNRYVNTDAIDTVHDCGPSLRVYLRGSEDPLILTREDAASFRAWLDTEAVHIRTRQPPHDGPTEDEVEAWYEAATESDAVISTLSVAEIVRVVYVAALAAERGDCRARLAHHHCADVLRFRLRGERLIVLVGPPDWPRAVALDNYKWPPYNLAVERMLIVPELDDHPIYSRRPEPAPEESEVPA